MQADLNGSQTLSLSLLTHNWNNRHCFPMLLFCYIFAFYKEIIFNSENTSSTNQILASLLV